MLYDCFFDKYDTKCEEVWLRRPLSGIPRYPLMLYFAGHSRNFTGWEFSRDNSNVFVIEYICGGNTVLIQENREYLINKGEVYLLRLGTRHYYTVGPAGFLFKRFIAVDGMELETLLRFFHLWGKDVLTVREPKQFERLLKQIISLVRQSPHSDVDGELSCLIYRVLLTLGQNVQPNYPKAIEQALIFMQHNLHRRLSLKELSNRLGLSYSHFNRLFATYLHSSPYEYFNTLKLNWAASLLKTTFLSVKEIAVLTGYDEPLYFSAQFKKNYGVSPKIYRSSNQS